MVMLPREMRTTSDPDTNVVVVGVTDGGGKDEEEGDGRTQIPA